MTAELTRFLNDRYDAATEKAEIVARARLDWFSSDALADLGSKRRIVNLLSPTWVSHCLDDCDICSVGRELAEPFAGVDGWREEWRPVREGELLT